MKIISHHFFFRCVNQCLECADGVMKLLEVWL